MGFLELPLALLLAAVVVYVLAILLRVSCHFCGAEIPALGRAFFTTAATAGLSILAALLIQSFFASLTGGQSNLLVQGIALLFILLANLAIAAGSYAALIDLPFGRAVRVWLVQAITFLFLGLIFGCCAGVISAL